MSTFKTFLRLCKYLPNNIRFDMFIILGLMVFSGILEILVTTSTVPLLYITINKGNIPNEIAEYLPVQIDKLNLSNFSIVAEICAFIILLFALKNIIGIFILNKTTKLYRNIATYFTTLLNNIYLELEPKDLVLKNIPSAIRNSEAAKEKIIDFIFAKSQIIMVFIMLTIVMIFLLAIFFKYILLVFIFMFVALMLYDKLTKNTLHKIGEKLQSSNVIITDTLNLMLNCIKEVKLFDINGSIKEKLQNAQIEFIDNHAKRASSATYILYFIEFINLLFFVAMAIFVTQYTGNVDILLPKIGAIITAFTRLLPLMLKIPHYLTVARINNPVIVSLFDEIDSSKNIPKSIKTSHYSQTEFNYQIEFKNVELKYPNTKSNTLENINISIKKNETIGIIGSSGAGKSTFADLLLGLLSPTQGEIFVDNNKISFSQWRHHVAYVPQNIAIINGTIKENIIFNSSKIDNAKLQEAVKTSGLEDIINQLPNKLESFVGQNGINLSGGQRQRIAIARALYFNRDLIVFDEATSALDVRSEHEITEAINRIGGKKTIIIIAHRLSTLKYCDKIIYFDKKTIIDVATFDELIERHRDINEILKMSQIK
jgi:ABC-type multidrug transport system fused ATPase/permease subunit